MTDDTPQNGEQVEVSGFLIETQERKVGSNAHNKIIRFPPKWINDLTENMNKPYLEIVSILDPKDGFCIIIRKIKKKEG